jgi:SAM-dependent methyltransferase
VSQRRRPSGRSAGGPASTSWEQVAGWYDGWVGAQGSRYHQAVAIPAVLELLGPIDGAHVLDVGAGQGVLAPYLVERGARYTGVDASRRLIETARRRHGAIGQFVLGDARRLPALADLGAAAYDAAVFCLSIQDMDGLEDVVAGLDWALRSRARVVLLMTHPAFRQPRHSGWGTDEGRGLHVRRIDAYLEPMAVPMKSLGDGPATRSFHRPISTYVNTLASVGFATDRLLELPDPTVDPRRDRARARAEAQIPLFLGLRAVRQPV